MKAWDWKKIRTKIIIIIMLCIVWECHMTFHFLQNDWILLNCLKFVVFLKLTKFYIFFCFIFCVVQSYLSWQKLNWNNSLNHWKVFNFVKTENDTFKNWERKWRTFSLTHTHSLSFFHFACCWFSFSHFGFFCHLVVKWYLKFILPSILLKNEYLTE
jgi:hypothetical protein